MVLSALLDFFILGLLAKPMLVTTPFVLFFLDWWPLKRSGISLRLLCKEKVPFFILSVIVGLITFFAQKGAMNAAGSLGMSERIKDSFVAYLWYLEKLFWPQDLSVLYLRPPFIPAGLFVSAVVVILLLSGMAAVVRKKCPYVLAGWLWFLVMLLPVVGLVPVGLQLAADRYTYLPCIGLFFAVTWFIFEMALRLSVFLRAMFGVIAIGMLVACAVASERQLAYWRNTETLMEHALQINPENSVAHVCLGSYYVKQGDAHAARFHHDRARDFLPKQ